TPIIDLTPPKPVSPHAQEHVFTATTATTTALLPPPPLQQQSTIVHELATHVSYSKIDNYVNETVKEAVPNALQAPVRECFRELSELEMKEILHDWMFKSVSYRSQPKHAALYDVLEVSMDHKNKETFIEATTKSCKRHRDDQDPPLPPLKDSNQSKKKRHDSDASASKPRQAWKTFDTKEVPSSSSKQKTGPQSEQPIDDVSIPNNVHILDLKNTGVAHLSNIKTRPDWLKPILEEERP
nr:hypothetical protein [Tanacetum cinerariifolium]